MTNEIEKSAVKELEIDGYKFTVDTDLLDDVEAFETIDRIENKGQVAAIVPLLNFLIGKSEYEKMKVYFSGKDAEENKEVPNYKPRFRLGKLGEVYRLIIENFDPKGSPSSK